MVHVPTFDGICPILGSLVDRLRFPNGELFCGLNMLTGLVMAQQFSSFVLVHSNLAVLSRSTLHKLRQQSSANQFLDTMRREHIEEIAAYPGGLFRVRYNTSLNALSQG